MLILTLAAAAALSTPQSAQPAEAAPTAEVRYGDLNLATPEGERALARRIAGAERQICGDVGRTDVKMEQEIAACRAAVRANAAPKMMAAVRNARERLASAQAPAVAVLTLSAK